MNLKKSKKTKKKTHNKTEFSEQSNWYLQVVMTVLLTTIDFFHSRKIINQKEIGQIILSFIP